YILTITFKVGVDLNMAQVLVQNRVALAEPLLPDLVKRRGVAVKKKSPSILMIVNLYSPGGTELRLIRPLNDEGSVPKAGKGLVVVAEVKGVLHFRMFDRDGKMVVDTDETELKAKAGPIADLRKRLEGLWPPHRPTEVERAPIISAVTSIVGHDAPDGSLDN